MYHSLLRLNPVLLSLAFPSYMMPLLHRSDFQVFDEYTASQTEHPSFGFPIHAFYGLQDGRVKRDMVEVRISWAG